MSPPWRQSASLILMLRHKATATAAASAFDYRLLMLRRSGRSKFMPNAYVFPGGVISKEDFSKDWKELLRSFGEGNKQTFEESAKSKRNRPMMMKEKNIEGIDRDIAFRICALRETFEESGVLLSSSPLSASESEVASWRPRVHEDPANFIRMCHALGACPNVWALREWSAWLTPVTRKDLAGRRFETVFYTALVDSAQEASHDHKETSEVIWTDPEEVLSDGEKDLQPPQIYELTRLSRLKTWSSLEAECAARQKQGSATWMPVQVRCSDSVVSVLPGDSLYPEEPDLEGARGTDMRKFDLPVAELNAEYSGQNRIAHFDKHLHVLYVDERFMSLTARED